MKRVLLSVLALTSCVVPPLGSLGALRCEPSSGHQCLANERCLAGVCVASSPNDGGACTPLATLPSWRRNLAVGEWKELTSADLSKVSPDPLPEGRCLDCRIDGWGGFAADTATSTLYLAASGGRDYAGNEVYRLALEVDRPSWELASGPSPASAVRASEYYSDGQPASAYPYTSTWYVEQRDKIYRFGANRTWGDGESTAIDSWARATSSWDPQGTNPRLPTVGPEAATGKDFSTGNVYQVQTDGRLVRWNAATNSLTDLGEAGTQFYKSPLVVDWARGRLILLSDSTADANFVRTYELDGGDWALAQVTGSAAGQASARESEGIAFYDSCLERIVVETGDGGDVTVLDPVTLQAEPLLVTGSMPPAPVYGVHTLFQWVPRLGGYAYQPRASTKVFFLATRND